MNGLDGSALGLRQQRRRWDTFDGCLPARRGPGPPRGASAGTLAQVVLPQQGRARRWHGAARTPGSSGGSSRACPTDGWGSAPARGPPPPAGTAGRGQESGARVWVSVGSSRGRCGRGCPGRPPRGRPQRGGGGRRLPGGPSAEGGLEELVGFVFRRWRGSAPWACGSARRRSERASTARRAAWAVGGTCSHNSARNGRAGTRHRHQSVRPGLGDGQGQARPHGLRGRRVHPRPQVRVRRPGPLP
jgi:hypothetical protein